MACPRLHHLELPTHPRPSILEFPWGQLQTCVLHGCAPNEALSILRLSSRIVEISLPSAGVWQWSHQGPSSETSATLQILTMSSSPDSAQILSNLRAPALQQLSLHDSAPGLDLPRFLTRSQCPLTHLTLNYSRMFSETLLEALSHTPLLTHLAVEDPGLDISEPFIRALTCTPYTQHLVPLMASLSLSGVFNCANEPVVAMLRSRASGALCVVRLSPVYGSPHIPFVKHLRAEGLDATCVDS
ncbi:hypothetical protein C8R44DRAFT_799077 [Mycena epipterygia]|nr:hypothetical protein C8R44DRAFT_799077 [Mycena epipterygia]